MVAVGLHAKRRLILHLTGAAVVICWLVLLMVLIVEVKTPNRPQAALTEGDTEFRHIQNAQREWKEIFLKERKVGYTVNLIQPLEAGYFIQEEILMRLNLMGLGSNLHTLTQCRADKNFLLESFLFSVRSGVVQVTLSGRREGDLLILESGKGKEKKIQTLKLTKIPMLGAGISHFFKSRKLTIGDTFSIPVFDPSTMSQREMIIRISAVEPLKINRMTYDAFRLETEFLGRNFMIWIGEDGSVLKEEGFMGLTTIKSSAAKAPENLDDGAGADLYDISAVKPDRALPEPNRLSVLKVRISGLEKTAHLDEAVLNGLRQEYRDQQLTIRKEKIPSSAGYSLPYRDDGRMKDFLKPEWNIESDEEEIRRKATEVSKGCGDPLSAARNLMQWVYENLEKKPVLSLPSALETLRTKIGDCNEHATLLTALLRAVGIPSRLSIGLAYSRDRFFYHAWTEAYLGEWVSMDATLNQMPVDPAHIKLIEGNLEKQVEIAALVGQIKMDILDFQYD